MVSLNPEQQAQVQQVKQKQDRNRNPHQAANSDKTGTKFHPNNQVKADHPKKPSPFAQILKPYNYEGGEITRWFVDAWDQFDSFEAACTFMDEQI